jgi:hypothetical protein
MQTTVFRLLTLGALAGLAPVPAAGPFLNAQLPWHVAVLDSQSKVLAWHGAARHAGWDQVLRLGWQFLERRVPSDTRSGTGLPIYLINPVFDPITLQGSNWQHNPAMVYASMVDSLLGWYPYSGDRAAIGLVRGMLDHQLAHGTTPADWEWPRVPYATSCAGSAEYGGCIQNMPRTFIGGIETDKIGELGTAYALFYELTGEEKYLRASIDCATALARHARVGDATHTPWAYRVDARTGSTLANEEYGGNITGPLRLFDELLRLKQGDVAAYARARQLAVDWLLAYPLNRESPAYMHWSGYFEDVARDLDDLNQVTPIMLAAYTLQDAHPETLAPRWTTWSIQTGRLLDWARAHFGRGPFAGAWAIDEQGTGGEIGPDNRHSCCSRAGLGSHTARWGMANALYAERTGDREAAEAAFRSLNYATYFTLSDGRVSCCGEGYRGGFWFSDGYADYLRHFSWAMGALPEYAPDGEDHLLRSTSVVQDVHYGRRELRYRAFDAAGDEVLRLGWRPGRVTGGSFTAQGLPAGDYVVRVHREASREVVMGGR